MIYKLIEKIKGVGGFNKRNGGDTQLGSHKGGFNEAVEHCDSEIQTFKNAEKAMEKLESLVALENVKQQVEKLTAFAWMSKIRESKGLTNQPLSLHMAFKGNPGTGKTTVARILGEILHSVGVLESPNVVEVSRSDLIGEYIGQSLPRVNKVIAKAKGGILLIDEAYSIVRSDSTRDYGYEVVDHLVKVMEDKRDEIMIIFTGYQKELEDFLETNTGLKSRINYHLNFPDYTSKELLEIFLCLAAEREYEVAPEAVEKLKKYLQPNPDNGRFVRNILERSIIKKAVNMYKYKTTNDFKVLTADDIVIPSRGIQRGKVGFIQ